MNLSGFEICSNNTNKLSPQELISLAFAIAQSSNNTNKLSPQDPVFLTLNDTTVQIIQINLVLKNCRISEYDKNYVQIIQINLVLKNDNASANVSTVFK